MHTVSSMRETIARKFEYKFTRSGFFIGLASIFIVSFANAALWWRTSPALSADQFQAFDYSRPGFDGPLMRGLGYLLQGPLSDLNAWFGSAQGLRLAPALLSSISLCLLYVCARNWFWGRSSYLTALILAASFWQFVVGKFYVDAVESLFLVSLMLFSITKTHYTKHSFWSAVWALTLVYSLYVPYGVVLSLGLLAAVPSEIFQYLRRVSFKVYGVAMLAMIGGVTPLAYSIYSRDTKLSSLLPFIDSDITDLETVAKQALSRFSGVFIRGPENWEYTLSSTPMINFVIVVLFVIGLLHLTSHIGAVRTRLMLSLTILPLLITAVDPSPAFQALYIPLVLLTASLGLAILLREWHNLFPLNPLAKFFGLAPIFAFLFLSVVFSQLKSQRAFSLSPRVIENYPLSLSTLQSDQDLSKASIFVSQNQRSVKGMQAFYGEEFAADYDPAQSRSSDIYTTDQDSFGVVRKWLGSEYAITDQVSSPTSGKIELFVFTRNQ